MHRLPILMYHHVGETPERASARNMTVSPNSFEMQMSFLHQKGYRCLSLLEVVSNWLASKPQPAHSFVLTCDDGWLDNYENALPVMRKFGFFSTVFVVVKRVEDGNKLYLSWQQMRELSQSGCTIGSHTVTHLMLSRLDNVTVTRELRESKRIIEDRLGLSVDLLAYPYGDSNESIQNMARDAGYRAACGLVGGPWSMFNLWRVPVYQRDSEMTFHWKAIGGYYTYNWLRQATWLGRMIRQFKQRVREKRSA